MDREPTINQAKRICEAIKARGVIVLAFDEEAVAGASYGETKPECKDMGVLLDGIVALVQSGELQPWGIAP